MGRTRSVIVAALIGLLAVTIFGPVHAWAGVHPGVSSVCDFVNAGPVVSLTPAAIADLESELAAAQQVAVPTDGVASGISVTIVPAPLQLMQPPTTVQLCRRGDSHRFSGVVRALRVSDPRMTDAGWTLRMTIQGVAGTATTSATLAVRRVEAFARTTRGIVPSPPGTAAVGQAAAILTALPGSGAGAFDVWVAVSADLPGIRGNTAALGIFLAVS